MPNTYIVKKLVADASCSELDFVLQKEFDFEYDDESDFITIQKEHADTSEAHPVSIDYMIKKLQEFKKKGATHLEIEHHVDHIGYDMSGWKITKATKAEVDEHLNKGKKSKIKQEKIAKLQNEIERIKNDEDENFDELVTQVELFFQEGTSDKVYQVKIEPSKNNLYVVNVAYGRRGYDLKEDTKTKEPVDKETALKIFKKVILEKKNKGYE